MAFHRYNEDLNLLFICFSWELHKRKRETVDRGTELPLPLRCSTRLPNLHKQGKRALGGVRQRV